MGHDRLVRRSWWRLPRGLGATVLAAGILTAGLPAGTALASQAAAPAPQYSLDVLTHVSALGHVWSLELNDGGGAVEVSLSDTVKGVSELHNWTSTGAFAATAVKDLKVTSTGHATLSTGSALSPVLGMSLAFTPVKLTKFSCAQGSESAYSGKVTGTLSLVTGLRGVKFNVKFSGQAVGVLDVDRACVPPLAKVPCLGSAWFLGRMNQATGTVVGAQTLGPKSAWQDNFGLTLLKTASKRVTRTVLVTVNGPAPKLNTAAKTVSVSGLSSGAVTGAAVLSYTATFPLPPGTCFLGGKKFKETGTTYLNGTVKISKPFQARSLLAGTLTMPTPNTGIYTAQKLTAA
jgi:hypothetical protein